MADFRPAFEKMIRNEGGYELHNVSGDRGGQTYAGIARNFHPQWAGWRLIDNDKLDNPDLTRLVVAFYFDKFWTLIQGNEIDSQTVAETLFDFAVNAGTRTAVKLAQLVVGATPDGVLGSKTLDAINTVDPEAFKDRYALAKIARYAEIVGRDRTQEKFLLGWIRRALA